MEPIFSGDRDAVWQHLWAHLERARYEQASAPSHANGVQDSNTALLQYMKVLKRFTDFTLYGTIPEDLLPPQGSDSLSQDSKASR